MTFSLSSHLHRSRRSFENFLIRPIGSIFTPQHFAAMNAAIPSTAERFCYFTTPMTTPILFSLPPPYPWWWYRSAFCLFFNWHNDIFFCVFANLYVNNLSNRDNSDVFRNSNGTGIYENHLVTSDICIKIKVNHPSELEHN